MAEPIANSLVSVVVPVYNVENYIGRCIESILAQTHKNLELILVDDGSPDNSGLICDNYASKDLRIRVIHTPNRGVSSARNAGIDAAKGDFLFFVDSDDWVESNHIEVLLPVEGEDLVYGGTKFHTNGVFTENRTIPAQIAVRSDWINNYSAFTAKGLAIFFIHPCYSMKIIHNHHLRFRTDMDCGEDGLFNITFLKHCNKIRYTGTCTYCYEDGDDTSNSLSHKYRPNWLLMQKLGCQGIEDMTQKLEYTIRWNFWMAVFRHFQKWVHFNNGIHKKEAKKKLKEVYHDPYFRECIPYIRKHGSLDQKVETFFMTPLLHPLFPLFYKIITLPHRLKRK